MCVSRRRCPPPPFIDTRRGGVHVRGGQKSSASSLIGGVQWSITVGSTLWSMAPGVAVILSGSLVMRRSRRRPNGSCGRRGGRCGGYRSPCSTWRRVKGPAGGDLALVKTRTSSKGCAHTRRGFCKGESTRSRQHSGKSSAKRVCTGCRRFPQGCNSAGDGRTVTGVGGWDFGHSCCAAWWPDAA